MKPTLFLLAALSLAACQSRSLGRLPREVVDLYDAGSPDGVIEIEADRRGNILEVEAEIPIADLPPEVVKAAEKELPTGTITGAEREMIAGQTAYEVKMDDGGRAYEFVLTRAGVLLENEVEITRSDAPDAVLRAAEAAVPGGAFKSVEHITKLGSQEYHVKFDRDGASYKVVLTPGGTVLRAVREARAEIEIPLR